MKYFYDAQIRRKILHFQRMFSDYYISHGLDKNGKQILQKVPCRFIEGNRQVEHILRNNSENAAQVAPMFTFCIDTIELAREKLQSSSAYSENNIVEREYDPVTQRYKETRGNSYNIKRLNPVNIPIRFKLFMWTTNIDQKLQLFEQLRLIYTPSVDIQESTNFLDWTNLSTLELTDWSWGSKMLPIGTDDPIDIMEFTFVMNTFLTPPAKVTPENQVETIIIDKGFGHCPDDLFHRSLNQVVRSVHTPGNHYIKVEDNIITLLDEGGITTKTNWITLFGKYNQFVNNQTQLKIKILTDDLENSVNSVFGTIEIHPLNDKQLIWTIDQDSLPSITLDPIDEVINPLEEFPDNGLPTAQLGQRYLLIDHIPENTVAWGDITAFSDDIIEYYDNKWNVVFSSKDNENREVVIDTSSNTRYLWDKDNGWVNVIEGTWRPGFWSLIFNYQVQE